MKIYYKNYDYPEIGYDSESTLNENQINGLFELLNDSYAMIDFEVDIDSDNKIVINDSEIRKLYKKKIKTNPKLGNVFSIS